MPSALPRSFALHNLSGGEGKSCLKREFCNNAERIRNGWSPEQIGNRLIQEGATLRVCRETIYRSIYSKEGIAQELW